MLQESSGCEDVKKKPEMEVSCKPVLLKDGRELNTKQQEVLLEKYKVKCTTRPLRAGRAKEYTEQEEQQQQQQQPQFIQKWHVVR